MRLEQLKKGSTWDTWLLEKHDLFRIPMSKDENCLFKAIAQQLYPAQNYYDVVKVKCIDHFRSMSIRGEPLAVDNFEHLTEREKLKVVAETFSRNVHLFTKVNTDFETLGRFAGTKMVIQLRLTEEGFYEALQSIDYMKKAAFCQSIAYELLYGKVFKIDKTKIDETVLNVRMKKYNNPGAGITAAQQNPDTSNQNCDSISYEEERPFATSSPTREDDGTQYCQDAEVTDACTPVANLEPKFPPFPFRVAKSLDPDFFRNAQFDLWLDYKKECQQMLKPGDKVNVKWGEMEHIGYVQNVLDKELVSVFVEKIGQRKTLPIQKLTKVQQPKPANSGRVRNRNRQIPHRLMTESVINSSSASEVRVGSQSPKNSTSSHQLMAPYFNTGPPSYQNPPQMNVPSQIHHPSIQPPHIPPNWCNNPTGQHQSINPNWCNNPTGQHQLISPNCYNNPTGQHQLISPNCYNNPTGQHQLISPNCYNNATGQPQLAHSNPQSLHSQPVHYSQQNEFPVYQPNDQTAAAELITHRHQYVTEGYQHSAYTSQYPARYSTPLSIVTHQSLPPQLPPPQQHSHIVTQQFMQASPLLETYNPMSHTSRYYQPVMFPDQPLLQTASTHVSPQPPSHPSLQPQFNLPANQMQQVVGVPVSHSSQVNSNEPNPNIPLAVAYIDTIQVNAINYQSQPSRDPDGKDMPITEMDTLRFFYNIGCEHYASAVMLERERNETTAPNCDIQVTVIESTPPTPTPPTPPTSTPPTPTPPTPTPPTPTPPTPTPPTPTPPTPPKTPE